MVHRNKLPCVNCKVSFGPDKMIDKINFDLFPLVCELIWDYNFIHFVQFSFRVVPQLIQLVVVRKSNTFG